MKVCVVCVKVSNEQIAKTHVTFPLLIKVIL